MHLDLIYNGEIYKVKVIDYIKRESKLLINYNGFIKNGGINCGNFRRGCFGGILNITQSSKNKFQYSEEHHCWFGWTTKGEKFAFDGNKDVVKYILSNTWYAGKNNIMNGKTKEPLHRVVWNEKVNDDSLICFISNELNLKEKFYDNRRVNLVQKVIKNDTVFYDLKYEHNIKNELDYCVVRVGDKYIKIDNDSEVFNKLRNWKLSIVQFNGKEYVSCSNKTNTKLLHRVLFGLLDTKYNKWQIDHINGDGLDNRMKNLVITNIYGNMCNVRGKGYNINSSGNYQVRHMSNYPDEKLFENTPRQPVYKVEEEAVREVNRRRKYVMKNRIYFKSKEELDRYIINNN